MCGRLLQDAHDQQRAQSLRVVPPRFLGQALQSSGGPFLYERGKEERREENSMLRTLMPLVTGRLLVCGYNSTSSSGLK